MYNLPQNSFLVFSFNEKVIQLEKVNQSDYSLLFCSHRWVENERVAKKAKLVWPKVVEVVKYWQSLPKS